MLPATVLFLVLLAAVHLADPDTLDRPLSMLRDGPWSAAGYALFALLGLIGVLHVRAAVRLGHGAGVAVPAVGVVLLAVVALTPSFDLDHAWAAFALMGLVYLYYALRLGLAGSPWLYAHLAFPVLLAVATSFSSYGIWQKGFVVYFLLAVNLDALPATGRWAEFGLADLLRRRKKRTTYHLKVKRRRTERRATEW
jgi:hypothetical protein